MIVLRPVYRWAHRARKRFGRRNYRLPARLDAPNPSFGSHLFESSGSHGRVGSNGARRRSRRVLVKRGVQLAVLAFAVWVVVESVRAVGLYGSG